MFLLLFFFFVSFCGLRVLHIVANGLTGQAGCVFLPFYLLAKPNTDKTKYTHTDTHIHEGGRAVFLFSSVVLPLLFLLLFGCCDFCCTNFVISLTFTCHTTTQLAQIESIETLCLHFRRSKLHSICCHQERQAALAAYDNRQHDATEGSVNHKGCARVCIQEHV